MRRITNIVSRLNAILGLSGLMIGLFSLLSFVFGLIVLFRSYNQPRETVRETLRREVGAWVRNMPADSVGLTLADYVGQWRRAKPADRPARLDAVRRALNNLGHEFDRQSDRYALIKIVAIQVGPRGGSPIASWRSRSRRTTVSGVASRIALGPSTAVGSVEMTLWYRVSSEVERAALSLEATYHRLLLALLGLSGYSLLCLGYMALHARALRDRAARESAQEATLDLADRTCHELGNVVFVLANERRNLTGHLDLVERFVDEEAEARATATRRAGLDPALAARFEHALRREYADRGIDPALELHGSVALARDVCRQIVVCSDYIAMTVRELDGYLKQSALPVSLAPVAVDACFDEALTLLGPRLEAASSEVARPSEADGRIIVRADRRLLVHALVNLLKNAVEASFAAGLPPRITLSAHAEGSTAWIKVADSGPGIPTAALPRVFDVGYSTKGAGRGRGLVIVRDSIRAQGGELHVSSRPGQGTEFRIGLGLGMPIQSGS